MKNINNKFNKKNIWPPPPVFQMFQELFLKFNKFCCFFPNSISQVFYLVTEKK